METIEEIKAQLREVNRDIEGMLLSNNRSEKAAKILADAKEYRAHLEENLRYAAKKSDKTPAVIGIIYISLN